MSPLLVLRKIHMRQQGEEICDVIAIQYQKNKELLDNRI